MLVAKSIYFFLVRFAKMSILLNGDEEDEEGEDDDEKEEGEDDDEEEY